MRPRLRLLETLSPVDLAPRLRVLKLSRRKSFVHLLLQQTGEAPRESGRQDHGGRTRQLPTRHRASRQCTLLMECRSNLPLGHRKWAEWRGRRGSNPRPLP